MDAGDSVQVVVAGESLRLPLSMRALKRLGDAQVCPVYLSQLAVLQGRPLVLTLEQACTVLAVGLVCAGVQTATPETVWRASRQREHGPMEVADRALEYLTGFLRDMPQTQAVPAAEGAAPKE